MRPLELRLRRSSVLLALALAAAPVACSTSTGGGGGGTGTGSTVVETACDPLAPGPITLGAIVGVGKDAAGTLYVDAERGIFLSSGGKLLRQHVVGTGQSGSNEYVFSFVAPGGEASAAQNLMVETTGGVADAMALGPDGKTFIGQTTTGVTALTLVPASSVSGMPLVNTPNVIQYVGDVGNGDVLVATNPMNEDSTASYAGLAVFYGPPSAVAQRVITDFQQSKSNSGTLTFLVDGTPYVLAFGSVYGPDAGPFGTFTLQSLTPQGGAPLSVTLRAPTPTAIPADLKFTCLP